MNNLNPDIKDVVQSQIDYTKNAFEDAQNIRDIIIANGGTHEEARKAYLDRISISKEMLEKFIQEQIENADSRKASQEDSKNQWMIDKFYAGLIFKIR